MAAEKREQHFVPKFYLRRFSGDEKRIHLYNFRLDACKLAVSLRHQCSRSNLYGADREVENALGKLENRVAQIIHQIAQEHSIPKKTSGASTVLLLHIVIQLSRTVQSGERVNEYVDLMIRSIAAKDRRADKIDWDNVRVGFTEPIRASLSAAVRAGGNALQDLCVALLITPNGQPSLITSDHPVVRYNKYLERAPEVGTLGFKSRGLLIYYPLDPTCALLLYDRVIYELTGDESSLCTLTENDIQQLNLLQVINSRSCVYFLETAQCKSVQLLAAKSSRWRGAAHSVNEYPGVTGPNKILIFVTDKCPNISLSLSFLALSRSAMAQPLLDRVNNRYRDKPLSP